MSIDKQNSVELTTGQSSGLSLARSQSLVTRGLHDLRECANAYEWWRRGRELIAQNRFDEGIACFEHGTRLDPDNAEGEWRFTFALDQLHTEPARNDPESVEWYRRGAELGVDSAQYELGWAYYIGHGVLQDYGQAASWFRRAADHGHRGAQYILGWLLHTGHGVARDSESACFWYRKAAEQGLSEAQLALGDMLIIGDGISRNSAEAAHWYEQATSAYLKLAEQGWPPAQRSLGQIYEKGQGVPRNREQAVLWYGRAAEQGDEQSQAALVRIESAVPTVGGES
jgi:TPR repeat protein